jgi:Ni/Co efflux regulator RcnB
MKTRSLGSLVLLSTLAFGSVAAFAEASQVEDPMQRQAERWGANNPGDPYTAYQAQNQGNGGWQGLNGYQYPQQFAYDDWQSRNLSKPPRGYHWARSGDGYVLRSNRSR